MGQTFSVLFLVIFLNHIHINAVGVFEDSTLINVRDAENENIPETLLQLSTKTLYEDPDESALFAMKALEKGKIKNQSSIMAKAYLNLGHISKNKGVNDTALLYYNNAKTISVENGFDREFVQSLIGIASVLNATGKPDSARLTLLGSINFCAENGLDEIIPAVINSLAMVYDNLGSYDSAIIYFLKAEKYYQKIADWETLAIILNNIGSTHLALGNYITAIEYLKRALEINLNLNAFVNVENCCSNLGIAYKNLDSLDIAIGYYQKALNISKEQSLISNIAKNHMNLAVVYKNMSVYDSAEVHYKKSIEICKDLNLEYGLLINYINLGNMYLKNERWELAYTHLMDAMVMIDDYQMPDEKTVLLHKLYQTHKALGNKDSALYYHEKYVLLNDSLLIHEQRIRVKDLELKYNNEKRLREIDKLNDQVAFEKNRSKVSAIILVAVVLLFIAFMVIFLVALRNRKLHKDIALKAQVQLQKENLAKEKELAQKTMHMINNYEKAENIIKKLKKILLHQTKTDQVLIYGIINDLADEPKSIAWDEFEMRFENLNQNFYITLKELYPDLTPNEIKICSLLKLNMNTKDMATLTHRSTRTIENTRTNIRRKLNLGSETNLTTFLLST